MFQTIKTFLKQFRFIKKTQIVVDATEYISLKSKKTPSVMEKAELTQHQLGSYVPSFEVLTGKKDDFKLGLSTFCKNTMDSSYWPYLIDHLKQDQVNNLLFNPPETRPSEDFVRGSINGIYIVDEQIRLLASSTKNKGKQIPNS